MTNADLERTIDDVARAMTSAEPPAALRARVMADRSRRSLMLLRVWLPYGATAAVAVIVIALVTRPSHVATPEGSGSAPVASIAQAAPQTRAVAPSSQAVRVAATRTASAPIAPSADFGLAPLPALAPLDADSTPIQPAPLAIPQLTVQPMKELAPLSIPALGDIDRQP